MATKDNNPELAKVINDYAKGIPNYDSSGEPAKDFLVTMAGAPQNTKCPPNWHWGGFKGSGAQRLVHARHDGNGSIL